MPEELGSIDRLKDILGRRKRRGIDPEGSQRAAVILLIYDKKGKKNILFTKRGEGVEHHKGEISLPGGAFDEGDSSLLDTALRETKEEIGLSMDATKTIGMLDDVPTRVSDFIITPLVAYLDSLPPLTINRGEIDGILEIPLTRFFDDNIFSTQEAELDGMRVTLNFFRIDGEVIWGATGAILRQFLDILTTSVNQE